MNEYLRVGVADYSAGFPLSYVSGGTMNMVMVVYFASDQQSKPIQQFQPIPKAQQIQQVQKSKQSNKSKHI